MCQSKSEGGMRCESHIRKAMASHQISFSNLVQQECMANGVIIDPELYTLDSEDRAHVDSQIRTDPAAKKAYGDVSEATRKRNKLRGTLRDALASGDVNRFATIIRDANPELKAISDDNEARKQKYAEAVANSKDENEQNELIASNREEMRKLNQRKERLNSLCKKEAMDAFNDYRRTSDSERIVHTLPCMKQVTKEIADIREKSDATISRVRKHNEELAIAYKVRRDPGYQEAMSSPSFINSPAYQKWEAKNRELGTSLTMTPGYQNDLATKISSYKKAGIDTADMEKRHKAYTVNKAKTAYNNIAEFHGASSPEAKAARTAYDEATQKVHVF